MLLFLYYIWIIFFLFIFCIICLFSNFLLMRLGAAPPFASLVLQDPHIFLGHLCGCRFCFSLWLVQGSSKEGSIFSGTHGYIFQHSLCQGWICISLQNVSYFWEACSLVKRKKQRPQSWTPKPTIKKVKKIISAWCFQCLSLELSNSSWEAIIWLINTG